MPGDRQGSFEPQLVRKHQTRWDGLNEKIIALYSRGMTVRDNRAAFVAIGVDEEGQKDVLGLWSAANEGANSRYGLP